MSDNTNRFGQVEFDEARGRLQVAGRTVELDRYCVAILAKLLADPGEQVSKGELLEAGWPGLAVEENSLAKAISRLRQALGEDSKALETVHRYGYRLNTDQISEQVEPAASTEPDAPAWRRPAIFASIFMIVLAVIGVAALSGSLPPEAPSRVINGEAPDAIGRVLWVDDHPENNTMERRFLENHKIAVYQVKTGENALALLAMYEYGVVISDMGRNDKPLAGLELLKTMRANDSTTPFVLYTVRSSDAQRRIVADAGGQRIAQTSQELYAAIMPLFDDRAPVQAEPGF